MFKSFRDFANSNTIEESAKLTAYQKAKKADDKIREIGRTKLDQDVRERAARHDEVSRMLHAAASHAERYKLETKHIKRAIAHHEDEAKNCRNLLK